MCNLNGVVEIPSVEVDFNAVAAKTADTGENVTIKGIYSVKGSDVKVALNNGNNVSINNLNITDKVSSVLLRGASKYLSTDTANAYINEFNNNSELPANVYQKAFYEYYRAGLAGMALSSVKSMYADVISNSTKSLAYNSGRADLAVKSGKSGKIGAETVKTGNTAANKSGGVVKAYNEQKLDNTQRSKLRVLDIYSESKGIKIHVVDDIRSQIRDKNGNTVKVNGKSVNGKSTAVISLKDGAKIYSKVAGHTLFSFTEEFSPEQTKALRDFVIGELKSDSGYNFDSEVLRYGKINNTTDLNIIYSQMAADLCFDVLNDSAAWNKLINTNKPLAKNLAMWYKQYAADITASVKKQFGNSNGQLAKASFKEAAAISETAGKWNDAVDGVSGNNYNNTVENVPAQMYENLNADNGGSNEGVGDNPKLKLVPPTKELRDKFDSEGLSQEKIDQIVSLPKSQKSKPETYLSKKYIEEHLQSFKDSGVVKIMSTEPTGIIGGKGGTFVMSGDQLDNIIKSCKGDVSKIEDTLGFDRGYLGKNPVIVEIHKASGLRMPDGNELGAFPEYWLPGGYTIGGLKEAVIDPAPFGTYTYKHLFK